MEDCNKHIVLKEADLNIQFHTKTKLMARAEVRQGNKEKHCLHSYIFIYKVLSRRDY